MLALLRMTERKLTFGGVLFFLSQELNRDEYCVKERNELILKRFIVFLFNAGDKH